MIAQRIHHEKEVSKLNDEVRDLRRRVNEQANQISELFARSEVSATKAELHAVMASLTFKDRVGVSNETLGDSILKIFRGKGHNSMHMNSDIQAFLTNPYETIAVLSEKLMKMEAQHLEDRKKMLRDMDKVQGELTRVQKNNEDLNFQFFKMQTAMAKSSWNIKPHAAIRPPQVQHDESEHKISEKCTGIIENLEGEVGVLDNIVDKTAIVQEGIDDNSTGEGLQLDEVKDVSGPMKVAPVEMELPSRQRTSIIRFPNKDNSILLQKLKELEANTEDRLRQLEKDSNLVRHTITTISTLNEEHIDFGRRQSNVEAQLQTRDDKHKQHMRYVVEVVEKCVGKVDSLSAEVHMLLDNMENVREDMQSLVEATMREARPEEKGVSFKSLVLSTTDQTSDAVPTSMVSKDIPGLDDIRLMVDGLQQLDAAFKQKLGIVEKLSVGQERMKLNVSEVEDSLQKLKYLVLHSIQLPPKPIPVPKNAPHASKKSHTDTKAVKQLEGYEMKMDRPLSTSACKGRKNACSDSIPPPESLRSERSSTAPQPSDRFRDEDFFSEGNFEITKGNQVVPSHFDDSIVEKASPPVAPPSARGSQVNNLRSKRMHNVDLVKGIVENKKNSHFSGIGACDHTLRNLSREWTSDSVTQLKADDWSRTVEAIKLRRKSPMFHNATPELKSGKPSANPKIATESKPKAMVQEEDEPAIITGDSVISKDFLSIMSSITDVEF